MEQRTNRRTCSGTSDGEEVSRYQSLADANLDCDTVGEPSYHGSPSQPHPLFQGRGKELGLSIVLQVC